MAEKRHGVRDADDLETLASDGHEGQSHYHNKENFTF